MFNIIVLWWRVYCRHTVVHGLCVYMYIHNGTILRVEQHWAYAPLVLRKCMALKHAD